MSKAATGFTGVQQRTYRRLQTSPLPTKCSHSGYNRLKKHYTILTSRGWCCGKRQQRYGTGELQKQLILIGTHAKNHYPEESNSMDNGGFILHAQTATGY